MTARRSPRPAAWRLAPAIGVAIALGVAACGSDGSEAAPAATSSTSAAPATTTEPGPDTTAPPASAPTVTTAVPVTATAAEPPDPADLPGEPFDLYPYEGAPLAVVGVDRDDVLNLRTGPGAEFPVAYALAPTVDGIEASGQNRQLDDGTVWAEVGIDGHGGWANVAYLAGLGATSDITADLGRPATGETMIGLAEAVAAQRVSSDTSPRVTVVADPKVADVGEITVDVLGIGDDAVLGERLHIVGTPNADGETFTTKTVEATALCLRGVADQGLCV